MNNRFALLDSVLNGIFVINRDHKIVYWNRVLQSVTGVEHQDIVNRPVVDLNSRFESPVIKERLNFVFRLGMPAFFSHLFHPDLLTSKNPASASFNIMVTRYRADDNNETYALFNIENIKEISNQILKTKKSEHNFKDAKNLIEYQSNILENVRDSILVFGLDGKISYWNKGSTNLFGYEPEECLGRNISILWENTYTKAQEVFMKDVINESESRRTLELFTKSGKTIWIDIKTSHLIDEKGKIIGIIGVSKDVTSVKAYEEELIEAKVQSEIANRAKTQFLASMSHELRTPLNGIIGLTDLTLDSELSQEQRKNLELILTSAENLTTLLNDILDVSRIDSGNMVIEESEFNLEELLYSTLSLLVMRIKEKKLSIFLNIPEFHQNEKNNIPLSVVSDPKKIRQILVNLVGNAIKFTAEGQIVVNIVLDSVMDDFHLIHFEISDTGIGIQADNIEKIFRPFEQILSQGYKTESGIGIGLTISKKIVELMNGKMWVDSQPGIGSSFHFIIPLRVSNEDFFIRPVSNFLVSPELKKRSKDIQTENPDLSTTTDSRNNVFSEIFDRVKFLVDNCHNDKELAFNILGIFLKNIDSYLENIETSVKEQNLEAVFQHAHKLKSSLSILCFNDAYLESLKLEDSARKEKVKQAEYHWKELSKIIERVKEESMDFYNELKQQITLEQS